MPIIEYGPPGHRGVDTVMGLGDLDVVTNVTDYPKALKHVMLGGGIAAGVGLLMGHRGLTAGGAGAVAAIAILRYLTTRSTRYQKTELIVSDPAVEVQGRGEGEVSFDLNIG